MPQLKCPKTLLVILTTVLLSPVPVPAKDTDFSRPSNAGATIPLERLQRWSETVSGLGSVKVLVLRRGSSAVGMRIESETDQSADAIEIDYAAREIRGFGLTFHSEYDGAGIPVGLTISNGSESVTLRPQPADSLADVERSAKTRLIKNFNGSNGPERVQQFMQLLRAARTCPLSRRTTTDEWLSRLHHGFGLHHFGLGCSGCELRCTSGRSVNLRPFDHLGDCRHYPNRGSDVLLLLRRFS